MSLLRVSYSLASFILATGITYTLAVALKEDIADLLAPQRSCPFRLIVIKDNKEEDEEMRDEKDEKRDDLNPGLCQKQNE